MGEAAAVDPMSLSKLLLYGSPETRRSLADSVRESAGSDGWAMLADTVRSGEPWLLRARCLELLGMVAAGGDERTLDAILTALLRRGSGA